MWAGNGMGRSDLKTGQILIRADLGDDQKIETLLHEIIHMISDTGHLGLENETIISVLSIGIFDVLRSNPELAERLCKK